MDEFTGQLWNIWKEVRDEMPLAQVRNTRIDMLFDFSETEWTGPQTWHLGIFRSDYMLHDPEGSDGTVSLGIKQVEFNTISSSFGALSERVAALHR